MNDLIDLIGGCSRFYVRGCEVQDFTSSLTKRHGINGMGGNEGHGDDGTLQTSLVVFCSSVLRILGGWPEAFASPRGTPDTRLGSYLLVAGRVGND
jgi:hypothetical protein